MSVDLSTKYMGLNLKNPIIIGSSGLTENLDNIQKLEKNGAAAVVLKSLFEEQINMDIDSQQMNNIFNTYNDVEEYIGFYTKQHSLNNYLKLISDSKANTSIPIIASINCNAMGEWTSFAKKIESAGADAIELNIFILPSDDKMYGANIEKIYFEIISAIISEVKIPVAVKMSHYFSGLANFAVELSKTGIASLVLFNRFFCPDVDILKKKIVSSNLFSATSDNAMVLRWVGVLSDKVKTDIAATTGINNGETLLKNLMVGAKAVQIASVLYQNGFQAIGEMLKTVEKYLVSENYNSLNEIIGIVSQKNILHPTIYERAQFMKYFSDSK